MDHKPLGEHPERPERLRAILDVLTKTGLLSRMQPLSPRPATQDELLAVHAAGYLHDLQERLGTQSASGWLDPDTYFSPGTYRAARLAAGGSVELALRVLQGSRDNGIALVRPPGHHACRDRAMGFCLLNNVAVAAAAAQAAGGRVAIVDFDVHHGNGTEHIFQGARDLLLISTHQYPFYPGTGAAGPFGASPEALALGTLINVPLPLGSTGTEYRLVFEQVVLPAVRRFSPDLVLVSAGFDGHARDPLAGMHLVESDYAWFCESLLAVQPRLALILEGGYHLDALAASVEAVVRVLLSAGDALPVPGASQPAAPTALPPLEEVRQLALSLRAMHHLR